MPIDNPISTNYNEKSYFFIGRVTSIILGPWDPNYTSEADIGRISYQLLYSPIGKRRTRLVSDSGTKPAYPMWGFVKQYPIVNEIVMIMTGPSKGLNDSYTNQQLFYFSPYNIWNDSNHNAFPDLEDYRDYLNQYVNKPEYAGSDTIPPEFPLGYTFKEKFVRNLQPFEGDILLQARFGQSIRFGSTTSAIKKSNTWSEYGENGDPITIITNQQGPRAIPRFETLVEDINKDGSSIYMTSTQQINIEDLNSFPLNSFGIGIDTVVQTFVEAPPPFPASNLYFSANEQDNSIQNQETPPVVNVTFQQSKKIQGRGEYISYDQSNARRVAISIALEDAQKKSSSSSIEGGYRIIEDKLFQTQDGRYRAVITLEFTLSEDQTNES